MRKIIIGDVHGCLDELNKLLEKVSYDNKVDKLFFVGDIINKGPHSRGVLDLIIKEQAKCVLGNHELGFLNYLKSPTPYKKYFEELKQQLGDELDKYLEYLEGLPLYWEDREFIMVHAGVSPPHFQSFTKELPRILTTIRTWDGKGEELNNQGTDPYWYDLYSEDKLIVFGHCAERGLVIRDNAIGLDSGCVYGNELSALIIPSREIVQVTANEAYCPI